MENVEYKAGLRDPDLARIVIRHHKAVHVADLEQVDTYFRVPDGRLKKRECEGEPTEWIMYHRSNAVTPRLSEFTIYGEEEALERFGQVPLPVLTVVKKRRSLWLYRNVRIHIDEVEGLGNFFELEAMVTPTIGRDACLEVVEFLRDTLQMALGEPISDSYSDMMVRQAESETQQKS